MIIADFSPFFPKNLRPENTDNSQLVGSVSSDPPQKNFIFANSKGVHPAKLRTDYRYSYCSKQRNKEKPFETSFANFCDSLDTLKEIIKQGWAIAPCHYKNGKRSKKNAQRFSLAIVDIDNSKNENGEKIYHPQLTIREALENEIINKYGAIYTSPSHTAEWNRYRIIFALPVEVDGLVYEQILKLLNPFCNNAFDQGAMEAGKQFFGNTEAEFYNWENIHTLPYELVLLAREEAEKVKAEIEQQKAEKLEKQRFFNQQSGVTTSEIEQALSFIDPDCDYYTWIRIGFALYDEFDGSDDGFTLFDNWSAQSSKYDGSEKLYRKWQSFGNSHSENKCTIATVFKYAIENGYKPPKSSSYLDPEHGQVIASGEEAIARARETVLNLTQDEIDQFFENHTEKKEFTKEQFIQWVQKKRKTEYKQRNKRVKPDVKENSRYCNYSTLRKALPPDFSGIIGIKSAKGTAKSGMIGKYYYDEENKIHIPDGDSLINDLDRLGYEIISGVPRIALAEEQSNRWNLEFINNAKDKYKCAIESDRINLCFDSLHYLTNRVYEGSKICLIMDEIHSDIEHLLSSSTVKERNKVLRELERLIIAIYENRGLIVLSDADLKQSHFDYFQAIINNYNGQKFDTFVYQNDFKYQDREVFVFNYEKELTNLVYKLVEQNQRLIIPVDSIDTCKAISESLTKKFPHKKIIPINSHSISDKEKGDYYRKFVTNPNETLQQEKPDVLLYTNSMGMGVSLDDSGLNYNYFDYVVCFANGVLAPDQVRQQIWRYRRQCPILLYVKERSHRHNFEIPFNPSDCEKNILKISGQSLQMSDYLNDIMKEAKNDLDLLERLKQLVDETGCRNLHLKHLAKILADRNYEFEHYRETLLDELVEIENNKLEIIPQGTTITINQDGSIHIEKEAPPQLKLTSVCMLVNLLATEFNRLTLLYLLEHLPDYNFASLVKEQKREIKIRHAVKLSESPVIDLERAKELASKQSLSEDERIQVEKAFLANTYTDLADNPEFCYLATRDKRKTLNAMKLGLFVQFPQIAKFYEHKAWSNFHQSSPYGINLVTDVKQLMPKVKLLRKLRINEMIADAYDSFDIYSDCFFNDKIH